MSKEYRRRATDKVYYDGSVLEDRTIDAMFKGSRKISNDIVLGLYKCVYKEGMESDHRYLLAVMAKGLFVLLKRVGIVFEQIGPDQYYHGLRAPYLINLDTEEDGSFYVGCSGGMDTAGEFEIEWENVRKDYAPYWLFITGLKGGHSGLNINEKRGNAIKLLAYLLSDLKQFNYQIGYLGGGSKRNAIPREAEALIYINPDNDFKVREIINDFALSSALEFKSADDGIKITFDIKEDAAGDSVLSDTFFNKVLDVILAMPHGPIAMSSDIPGLVETSTNLATITINENTLSIGTSQRSSIENAKKNIGLSVKSIFDLSQAKVKVSDGYPGWQPNLDSKFLRLSMDAYEKEFGKEPGLKAVHAGLECGILGNKFPGLEMISIGPTIQGAHSPDERVRISDVDKFYRLIKVILVEISNLK